MNTPTKQLHRLTYIVENYNDRRYSKPWIARINNWQIGQHPEIEFGITLDGDTAEITAYTDDIIRYGQKDHRNPRKTKSEYAIVLADGTYKTVSANQAREHWIKIHAATTQPINPLAEYSTEALQTELKRRQI